MTVRLVLAAVWLAGVLLPLAWWLRHGRAGPPGAGRWVGHDGLAGRRDRLLADLGARLAHDVTTPLAALTGHLDLIAHEPISAAARRSVEVCQAEIERVSVLATDLLTLTTVRAGAAPRSVVPAGALAEEAVAGLLDRADSAGAQLTVRTPDQPVCVRVADGEIVRALRNLVANALEHGLGSRRAVTVTVAADPGSVRFWVADSGPGLTAAELDRLVEPLVRGPAAGGPGSGLGLAIVAEVLAAHGTRLELDPAGDGGGAVLGFALPRADG